MGREWRAKLAAGTGNDLTQEQKPLQYSLMHDLFLLLFLAVFIIGFISH